ncbi:MAG: hypothetical protein P1S60_14975, partial [Anaerolineae bacterium]|nr:hypothetical protein [Anaerolineae bacterium]
RGIIKKPQLVVGKDGVPVVAYTTWCYPCPVQSELWYGRFTGGSWEWKSIDFTGEYWRTGNLLLNSEDEPLMVYWLGNKIYYLSPITSEWYTTTAPTGVGGPPYSDSLILDRNDQPAYAWSEVNSPSTYVYFVRLEGGVWQRYPRVTGPVIIGIDISLALDNHNNPHIFPTVAGFTDYFTWNGGGWIKNDPPPLGYAPLVKIDTLNRIHTLAVKGQSLRYSVSSSLGAPYNFYLPNMPYRPD